MPGLRQLKAVLIRLRIQNTINRKATSKTLLQADYFLEIFFGIMNDNQIK